MEPDSPGAGPQRASRPPQHARADEPDRVLARPPVPPVRTIVLDRPPVPVAPLA